MTATPREWASAARTSIGGVGAGAITIAACAAFLVGAGAFVPWQTHTVRHSGVANLNAPHVEAATQRAFHVAAATAPHRGAERARVATPSRTHGRSPGLTIPGANPISARPGLPRVGAPGSPADNAHVATTPSAEAQPQAQSQSQTPTVPVTLPTVPVTPPVLPITPPALPLTPPQLPITPPTVQVPTLPNVPSLPALPAVTVPSVPLPSVTVPSLPNG